MGYTLIGGELSLFTRKLEAALIFYGADFISKNKNEGDVALIEARSGTHQVPVLLTPENWMLADTTPILSLLDARFRQRQMFPDGPLGVLVHCLEEFFDEWVARVMVHYRWHYAESAEFAATRMSGGNPAIVERMLSWGPRACRATGTDSEKQRIEVEAEYDRIMVAAEAQLQETSFLLGNRPTALDCIVLGGLRAHTNMDPDPKRHMKQFPTVVNWAEEHADQWDGTGELAEFPQSTAFARVILAEMPETYGRYVTANAESVRAGAKACHCETYGEDVSYLTRPYPERSREMVVNRIATLDTDGQSAVAEWLSDTKLSSMFGGGR
jgi:glutathione S-transferase